MRPRQAWNLLDPDVLVWQQDGAVSQLAYSALAREIETLPEHGRR